MTVTATRDQHPFAVVHTSEETAPGLRCQPLHDHLERFIDTQSDRDDAVAERAAAIDVQRKPLDVVDVTEQTRRRMDRLGELDTACQDMLVDVTRIPGRQRSIVRDPLRQSTMS